MTRMEHKEMQDVSKVTVHNYNRDLNRLSGTNIKIKVTEHFVEVAHIFWLCRHCYKSWLNKAFCSTNSCF